MNKPEYICRKDDCSTIACFGYDNDTDRNTYCLKHRQCDMSFTFQTEDLKNIDIFDLKKTQRKCIMKDCNTTASCIFYGESKRLFCAKHKLDYMLNYCKACSCKSGKPRLYNILGQTKSICCEDCKSEQMVIMFDRLTTNLKNGERLCTICNIYKNESDYKRNSPTCISCAYIRKTNYINSNKKAFLKNLLCNAKTNAKQRTCKGRIDAGYFDLIYQDLESLYDSQKGLCYYSHYPMNLSMLSDFMCSLERLDPSKGYTKDNVALVLSELNGRSQWTKQKFDEFSELLFQKHTGRLVNFSKSNKPREVRKKEDANSCKGCNIFKNESEFNKTNSLYCKDCIRRQNNEYGETPWGNLTKILNSCRARHKNKPDRFGDCDLKICDLIDLFNRQQGLCAYSGIPMQFGNSDKKSWVCSLERVDPLQGYILSNICFIVHELNTADFTSVAVNKGNISGSGAWSKRKIEMLKEYIKENNLI